MRVEQGFQPIPYEVLHPFNDDLVLPSLARRLLPPACQTEIFSDLLRFGDDLNGYIRAVAQNAETPAPSVTQYDHWGRRIDKLNTSEGWRALKGVAAKEGLVSISYERKYGEHSRIYAALKIIMWQGDGRMTLCPLSMTDGAARVLELLGSEQMKADLLPRLLSRNPSSVYTAGQFMTERPGGSDLSETETIATPSDENASQNGRTGATYKLSGFKWFSSATDGEVALALARTGTPTGGSKSLSLFLLPIRLPLIRASPSQPTTSNGVHIHRLKNKIGTHALPTAELSLNDSEAYLVGPLNRGVKSISTVLNITRLYSAMHSVGNLSRCLAIAQGYALVRRVPGNSGPLLKDMPLHTAALVKPALTYRALCHLTIGVVALLGKSECATQSPEEASRLRLLTPVIKAFAAEYAVAAMEECMSALGGQGYMEENEIGRLIRDALVEKIWEGTITVLSLDVVRSVSHDGECIAYFLKWATDLIQSAGTNLSAKLTAELNSLSQALETLSSLYQPDVIAKNPLLPRPLLFLLGHITSALYLLEHAIWSVASGEDQESDIDVVGRWVREGGLEETVKQCKVYQATDPKSRMVSDSRIVYGAKL